MIALILMMMMLDFSRRRGGAAAATRAGSSQGVNRLYSDDTPGLKVYGMKYM
jgi:hypothetical protein